MKWNAVKCWAKLQAVSFWQDAKDLVIFFIAAVFIVVILALGIDGVFKVFKFLNPFMQ